MGEGDLDEFRSNKHHGNKMLGRAFLRARDGKSLQDLALVAPVISQDRVRRAGHLLVVIHAGVTVDRDHVRPMIQVLLLFGRKLTLLALRPTFEITDLSEFERRRFRIFGGAAEDLRPRDRQRDQQKPAYMKMHSPWRSSAIGAPGSHRW